MKIQPCSQLILLAHGSRDDNWCQTFEDGLTIINAQLAAPACLAYMEMATPGLESVVSRYYLRGIRQFAVLPLFFAEGRHLLHDVPALISTLEGRFESIRIELLDAVGRQPAFWEFLGDMIAGEHTTLVETTQSSESNSQ